MAIIAKRAFTALICAAAAACGPDADTGLATRSDSLGVEVVTNLRPPTSIPIEDVDTTAVVEISGDQSGGTALYRITAVTRLPGNRIGVSASGSNTVLVFDSAGSLAATFGRGGEGPGEFASVQDLLPFPGDSLAVYDPQQRRLTVFDATGTPGREIGFDEMAPERGSSRVHAMPQGMVLVGVAVLRPQRAPGTYRDRAAAYGIDRAGNVVTRYGDFPGVESFRGAGLSGPLPFGATLFTATVQEHLVVGMASEPELRYYAPAGELTRIVRWPDHERAVTRARMDQYLEHMLAEVPEEQRPAVRAQTEGMPFAERAPVYHDIIASPEGSLWVGDYPGPEALVPEARGPRRLWLVLDRDGVVTKRVRTPEGFRPLSLDGANVLGVYVDALGVESVRVYRIG